ncbi:hypothetical protein TorRG33x02_018020, partial [Trema orientale]
AWFRSISAVHLLLGSFTKHLLKKSLPSSDNSSGIPGSSSPPIRTKSFQIFDSASRLFQAGFPVAISTTAHPRAQISQGGSYSLSFTDSGDIYKGVPLNSHLCSVFASSVFEASLASPKSAILAAPLSKKRIF